MRKSMIRIAGLAAVCIALGGSTNGIIHLTAIAGREAPFGSDLATLEARGKEIKRVMAGVRGITDLTLVQELGQPALSRLEAGGVVPTIPLLERISIALDADLIVEIAPHAA